MAANTAPHEIISAAGSLYVASIGTTFPTTREDIDPTDWDLVGNSGDLDYTRDGIKVASSQTMNKFQSLGSTGIRKIFRSEEGITVEATVADMTPAMLAHLIGNSVSGTGSNPRKLAMSRLYDVKKMALLCRFDVSAGILDGVSQVQIPEAVVESSPEPVYRGGDEAVAVAAMFTALRDPNATSDATRYGIWAEQSDYITTRFGLSQDASAQGSELNVAGNLTGGGTIPAWTGSRRPLVASIQSDPNIKYIYHTSSGSPTQNRISSYTRQSGTIPAGGHNWHVWVHNTSITGTADLEFQVA